ncbi:MAG TPA: hypothetical protein VHJ17_23565 [Thermomonospora sp.]|nr:hypothetical protein [Thermomonospora sp.]
MPHTPHPFVNAARRCGTPALLVVLGTSGGLTYGLLEQPEFTSDAHVMVVADPGAEPSRAMHHAQAYARLVRQPGPLTWAQVNRSGDWAEDIRRHVRVTLAPDAPVIALTGSGPTPDSAAAYANAVAGALIEYADAHHRDTGVRVTSMSPAAPPTRPTSPNLPLSVAVGASSGLLLAGLASGLGGSRKAATT